MYTDPVYVSLSVTHQDETNVDGTIDASIYQSYNYPILNNAQKYAVAIERMELSLNAVPFYNATNRLNQGLNENIIITSKILNNALPFPVTQNAYDLSELLTNLSQIAFLDPDDGVTPMPLTFGYESSGYIKITFNNHLQSFNAYNITIPKYLNAILGISLTNQLVGNICVSTFPRVDLGDCLQHIVLTSSLPTIADVQGQGKENVLTDMAAIFPFSNNFILNANNLPLFNSVSTGARQKIVYVPTERRFLQLIGAGTLNFIRLSAMYADSFLELNTVPLPYGGVFQIKLGFYKIK